MELLILRHLWGITGTMAENLPHFLQTGYDGIEAAVPPAGEREIWQELFQSTHSKYIAQIFTAGDTPNDHLRSFQQQIKDAQVLQPLLINCHSGCDAWSFEDNLHFYREAVHIEAGLGIPVAHETHRGRALFHPWITERLLNEVDDLWLCADFSHWVCVCERLLEDQEAVLAMCIQRTRHIHARVGYEEGPQVPDPRAPEYAQYVAAHERWWEQIWQAQAERETRITTLTPEFGPPNYMHTLPYTQMPVADLAAICDWQAERQRQRFSTRF